MWTGLCVLQPPSPGGTEGRGLGGLPPGVGSSLGWMVEGPLMVAFVCWLVQRAAASDCGGGESCSLGAVAVAVCGLLVGSGVWSAFGEGHDVVDDE
jgi:hypothetical protein